MLSSSSVSEWETDRETVDIVYMNMLLYSFSALSLTGWEIVGPSNRLVYCAEQDHRTVRPIPIISYGKAPL